MNKLLKRLIKRPQWNNLRSVNPISSLFGSDRGTPIDRFYIEDFLSNNSYLVKGHILEIADASYSKKFGAKIEKYEVLHSAEGNNVTIAGDLTDLGSLPENKIDCFICTQTFNFIYDFKAAIKGARHLLKPGGYLLATVSGISQISRYDMERWGDYWRFTTLSIEKTFGEVFGEENVNVDFYGNVLAAVAFLEGISAEELTKKELLFKDENYQVTIVVKAKK
ncbi:class I SAM-dependent methyltransferase [Muriicola sp. Z0-33]|uniref:class I SAM-dependent methyltransferase n=1 Tax=Muriicola sp. Z0-33 TaxID=2816957 RepID=UPI0022380F17|nr:class I SAM-dependent methyltransferase [Muriicola sp. Z0-33]MCW5517998.1 methyltransferase domain-containing protein [Muriicola sp. Z0-33]